MAISRPRKSVPNKSSIAPQKPIPGKLVKSGVFRLGLPEKIYRLVFERSDVAQFVADGDTGRILQVNQRFSEMCGYAPSELNALKMAADLFPTNPEDPPVMHQCTNRAMHLLMRDGRHWPVDISVTFALEGTETFVIATVTDRQQMHQLQETVRQSQETARQQRQAGMRVMQIATRIMLLPNFMEFLESIDEPRLVFKGVCDFLCNAQGMEYGAAAVFQLSTEEENLLELKHSLGYEYPPDMPLDDDNPIAAVARGDLPSYQDEDGNICAPIVEGEEVAGVLCVQYHYVTRQFIEEDLTLKETLLDLFLAIARLLGLRLQNMSLLRKVQEQTVTDALTGIFNRRFFDTRLVEEFNRAKRYSRPLSLIMIDMDKFKQVNDTLGHQQGDTLLIEFANICKETSRKQDLICRMGGDEFAMILPDTPHWAAALKAEKLRKIVEERDFQNIIRPGEPVKVSLSVGVCGVFTDMETVEDFYQEADEVMYYSKEHGRNQVTVARPEIAQAEAAKAKADRERRIASESGRRRMSDG